MLQSAALSPCFPRLGMGWLALLLILQKPALAEEAEAPVERIAVSYVPQDLTDPVRAKEFLKRIDRAALAVCGNMDGLSRPMQDTIERSACHYQSLRRAISAFHSPLLTHMLDARNPRIGPTRQEP